jgi:peptide/nickel transport system permease protein
LNNKAIDVRDALKRFLRNRAAAGGALFLLMVVVAAILGPILYTANPWDMVSSPLQWPGDDPSFPLGTDMLGRDVLAGMLHGARISLAIGLVATMASLLVGILVGAISGYYGGWVDTVLMRTTEVVQTVPAFLLCIVLVVAFKPSLATVVIAIAIASWPAVARLVRGEVLSLRQRDFVLAARTVGMTDRRILLTQILPSALPPVIVMGSLMVATAILVEAGLSFLGLSDPNVMTWGVIIGAGRDALAEAWYLAALPGLAITLTVMSLNLVGEGINDALNPRLKDR